MMPVRVADVYEVVEAVTERVGVKPVGMTELEGVLVAPVPVAFVADTVKLYEVPLARPVAMREVLVVVALKTEGFDMRV